MNYKSKVGYSIAFKKKELIYFFIGVVIIISSLLIFMPPPINYFLSLATLITALIFIGAGILFMKIILGVVTEIEGDNIKIYKADSYILNPKNNEVMFTFGKGFHASINITKNNISSVRKITNSEEIDKIKKMDNVFKVFRVSILGFPENKSQIEKISFVSDYKNIVEIRLKNLSVKYPSILGSIMERNSALGDRVYNLKNTKILVSVKNPEEFINFLKK